MNYLTHFWKDVRPPGYNTFDALRLIDAARCWITVDSVS